MHMHTYAHAFSHQGSLIQKTVMCFYFYKNQTFIRPQKDKPSISVLEEKKNSDNPLGRLPCGRSRD